MTVGSLAQVRHPGVCLVPAPVGLESWPVPLPAAQAVPHCPSPTPRPASCPVSWPLAVPGHCLPRMSRLAPSSTPPTPATPGGEPQTAAWVSGRQEGCARAALRTVRSGLPAHRGRDWDWLKPGAPCGVSDTGGRGPAGSQGMCVNGAGGRGQSRINLALWLGPRCPVNCPLWVYHMGMCV